MTTKEFKEKYPQYKDLEGDDLWDIMTEMLLQSENVLTADPYREIIYHKPITIPVLQDINTNKPFYKDITFYLEDESKTTWLNNKKERAVLNKEKKLSKAPTESYSFVIL